MSLKNINMWLQPVACNSFTNVACQSCHVNTNEDLIFYLYINFFYMLILYRVKSKPNYLENHCMWLVTVL